MEGDDMMNKIGGTNTLTQPVFSDVRFAGSQNKRGASPPKGRMMDSKEEDVFMTVAEAKPLKRDRQTLVRAIDHTKLTFAPGEDQEAAIKKLCQEAKDYGFYAVCVRPQHIALSKKELQGSDVKVATVIGFPQEKMDLAAEKQSATVGNPSTMEKLAEVGETLKNGADELDLVLNVALFKREMASGGNLSETLAELHEIQNASQGRPVKVIIETDLLTDEEIARATRACVEAGVAMVKTSTGMLNGGRGATPEGVGIIRRTIDEMKAPTEIKASGGIKNAEQAFHFLEQGVSRLGTSSGIDLVQETSS